MGSFIDLTGERFGRLNVFEREPATPENVKNGAMWKCKCDCGNTVTVKSNSLRSGHTKSCGCYHNERTVEVNTTHGKYKNNIYRVWSSIKERCCNPHNKKYLRYGARGIAVCEEWKNDFSAFYDYVSRLPHFGEAGYSIDRINNDGNYEPGNVRWADFVMQNNNLSRNHLLEYGGKTQSIAQWAREIGMSYSALHSRIKRGWSIERAMAEPVKK